MQCVRSAVADNLSLLVDDHPLPIVSSVRNLGVHFGSSLRFKLHINFLNKMCIDGVDRRRVQRVQNSCLRLLTPLDVVGEFRVCSRQQGG